MFENAKKKPSKSNLSLIWLLKSVAKLLNWQNRINQTAKAMHTLVNLFKYNNATNEFAIGRPDGVISTLFRPIDGRTYWLEQIKLYGGDSVVFGGK
jgi:pyocin large subunit-like protein